MIKIILKCFVVISAILAITAASIYGLMANAFFSNLNLATALLGAAMMGYFLVFFCAGSILLFTSSWLKLPKLVLWILIFFGAVLLLTAAFNWKLFLNGGKEFLFIAVLPIIFCIFSIYKFSRRILWYNRNK